MAGPQRREALSTTNEAAARGEVVALTQSLVRIPSVNPELEVGGTAEAAVAIQCAAWLESWGFETRRVEVTEGRWNVTGSLGSGSPVTMLNGHLDTVGVAGMSIDPFAGEIHDGRLWGRGSADMKGGVAAVLAAAKRFSDAGARAPGTLHVVLTADEEHASLGMQAYVAGDVAADRAVVTEPTGLAVMPAHKGFLWLTATFEGVAAHGSRPEVGVDAVRHAGWYMAALEALHDTLASGDQHPLLGPGSFHFGRAKGGSAPSVYPDRCTLEIERRTLPHEGPEVEREFRSVLETLAKQSGVRASLEADLYRPGSDVPVDSPVVVGLLEAIAAGGHAARVEGMTAWVDAAYLNLAGIPTVCFGPGSIEAAHTADESVPVAELEVCADVLARFLGL